MRNDSGTPFAFKVLDDGYWNIYFDPSMKLNGYFYYEQVSGPIDGSNAELIVDLLNKYHESKLNNKGE